MDLEWSDSISDVAMESPTKNMIGPYATDNHRVQFNECQSNAFIMQTPRLFTPLGQDASRVARTLIRADAAKFFADNLEDMASFWTELLHSTCLQRNVFCADAGVTTALHSLDKILSAENSTPLALRLAFVQLPRVLDAANNIFVTKKWQSSLEMPVTNLDNSIPLDMCPKAQGKEPRSTKRELNLRRRLAQRWVDISATHPLLLVTYTGEAESIISNFAIPNRTLQAIAAEAVRALPAELIQASAYFTQAAQICAGSIDASHQLRLGQCLEIVREILSSAA